MMADGNLTPMIDRLHLISELICDVPRFVPDLSWRGGLRYGGEDRDASRAADTSKATYGKPP